MRRPLHSCYRFFRGAATSASRCTSTQTHRMRASDICTPSHFQELHICPRVIRTTNIHTHTHTRTSCTCMSHTYVPACSGGVCGGCNSVHDAPCGGLPAPLAAVCAALLKYRCARADARRSGSVGPRGRGVAQAHAVVVTLRRGASQPGAAAGGTCRCITVGTCQSF